MTLRLNVFLIFLRQHMQPSPVLASPLKTNKTNP